MLTCITATLRQVDDKPTFWYPVGLRFSRPASKLCGAATFSNPDDPAVPRTLPPKASSTPIFDRSSKQTNKKGRTHHESLKRSKDLILVYYLLKTNKHKSAAKSTLSPWHLHQAHWNLTLVMTRLPLIFLKYKNYVKIIQKFYDVSATNCVDRNMELGRIEYNEKFLVTRKKLPKMSSKIYWTKKLHGSKPWKIFYLLLYNTWFVVGVLSFFSTPPPPEISQEYRPFLKKIPSNFSRKKRKDSITTSNPFDWGRVNSLCGAISPPALGVPDGLGAPQSSEFGVNDRKWCVCREVSAYISVFTYVFNVDMYV